MSSVAQPLDDASCLVEKTGPGQSDVLITIAPKTVAALYRHALAHYQHTTHKPGFITGAVPAEYVERNYRAAILKHVEQVLFNTFAIDMLVRALHRAHQVVIGAPVLVHARIGAEGPAEYLFRCNTITIPIRSGWKQLHFRPPGRKNYRDIDNQVKSFIAEEVTRKEKATTHGTEIVPAPAPLDWINATLALTPSDGTAEPMLTTEVWMKIGVEEADADAQQLFRGKTAHSSFPADTRFFQDYFAEASEIPLNLNVTVQAHLPDAFFCFERFRHQFKLKSAKEVHKKLIEVFSFRHDISQRREIVDTALRTLFKEHLFGVPRELVDAEMETLNQEIHANPDYYVYKTKDDFEDQLRKLAHKQLKELALIDTISLTEKIEVTQQDIMAYLNLLKRPRTREFVYFPLPSTKVREQEFPLSAALVAQACRREKTLNHIISHLSRT